MNPLTNMKNVIKLSENELKHDNKSSWHDMYKDSAWIFVGGLSYDLTEGDLVCIFSQYGEIVNINLIRDKTTGKSKGYCFICYEDQRSTVLAVDNFNGIKILNRTIRVDHVSNYKIPKIDDELDDITKKLRMEGCAPKPQIPIENIKIEKNPNNGFLDNLRLPERLPIGNIKNEHNLKRAKVKKEKKSKKSKKNKKEKKNKKSKKSKMKKHKKNRSSSSSSSGTESDSSESDPDSTEPNLSKDNQEKCKAQTENIPSTSNCNNLQRYIGNEDSSYNNQRQRQRRSISRENDSRNRNNRQVKVRRSKSCENTYENANNKYNRDRSKSKSVDNQYKGRNHDNKYVKRGRSRSRTPDSQHEYRNRSNQYRQRNPDNTYKRRSRSRSRVYKDKIPRSRS